MIPRLWPETITDMDRKHDLRHRKPFICTYPGCQRSEGFSTTNDLDRHMKSKHPSCQKANLAKRQYRCHIEGCKSREKAWPRLDNFRSHLKRVHRIESEDMFEDMTRRCVNSLSYPFLVLLLLTPY